MAIAPVTCQTKWVNYAQQIVQSPLESTEKADYLVHGC